MIHLDSQLAEKTGDIKKEISARRSGGRVLAKLCSPVAQARAGAADFSVAAGLGKTTTVNQ